MKTEKQITAGIKRFFKEHWSQILMLCCIAAGILWLICSEGLSLDELLSYTPQNPLGAAAVLWVLFALKGICAVILYDVLVLAAGSMFSLPFAIFVSSVGTLITIHVPYLMGRFSKGLTPETIAEKHPRLAGALKEDNQILFCLIVRILGLSNEAIGLFFGSSRLPYVPYILISFFGMLPGMLCFTFLGDSMDLTNPYFLLTLGISVAAMAAVLLIRKCMMKKRKNADKE